MKSRSGRRWFVPFALGAAVMSCDRVTAPEPQVDRAQLERAVLIHVDLTGDGQVSAGRYSRRGATLSIVGSDAVDVTVSGLTRAPVSNRKDVVRFDVAVVNKISGHELRAPTGMPAPNATSSVFVFPYTVKLVGGAGQVEPSSDWDGALFDFFTGAACKGKADCFPWESYPAPLRPGQTSSARNVGFIVDKSVTSFDVYLLTAADIVEIPTGSLDVTVTSATRGPLPLIDVVVDGSIRASTNAAGIARFTGLGVGTPSVTITSVPAGCATPDPVTAAITASQTAAVSVEVSCPPARLEASESGFQFGDVPVGMTSAARRFTISNAGGSPAGVIQTALAGPNASDFSITHDGCINAALDVGRTCAIDVAARPGAPNTRTASLIVTATPGGAATFDLEVHGSNPAAIGATPAAWYFSSPVGIASGEKAFTFTNSGDVPTGAPAVSVTGTDAASFSIVTNGCTTAIAAGASCDVSVSFSSTALGNRSATLRVAAAPGGSASVALLGSATVAKPVITSFSASQTTITAGSATTLTAVFSGGTAVITPAVGPLLSSPSTVSTGALSANTTFTLTVSNSAGSVTATVTVNVVPPPTIVAFTATPAQIGGGASSTLLATFNGGTGIVDHGIGPVVSGVPVSTGVLAQNTTFTLVVTNAAGSTATASVGVTVNVTGALTLSSVRPVSLVAGANGEVAVSFIIQNTLPADGRIAIDFPVGFNFIGATCLSWTGVTGICDPLVHVSGQTVTIARIGTGPSPLSTAPPGTAMTIRLDGVRNPQVSGPTGQFGLRTITSAGATIDVASPPGVAITPGGLTGVLVSLASSVAGATGIVAVEFNPANPWPANGKLDVIFPAGFDVSAATCTGIVPSDGTCTASVSGQTVTITRVGAALPISAGNVLVGLGNIRNPTIAGTTGLFTITTKSGSLAIDVGFFAGLTIVP